MPKLRPNTKLETDKIKIKERGQLLNFFSNNPAIGLIGTIVTVIGVILSIYFFIASKERPDLTYMVNSTKTAVFRNGQTSNLTVQYNGKEIKNDITAVQVVFWNAGKQAIWANSVLKPLIFRTSNKARIIDINLRKQTRDVTEIKVDRSRLDVGEVKAQWRILEENDGGIIQIIYEGNEDVKIEATATIEGQKKLEKSEWRDKDPDKSKYDYIIIITLIVIVTLTGSLVYYCLKIFDKSKWDKIISVIVFCPIILFLLYLLYKLTIGAPIQPPFNF